MTLTSLNFDISHETAKLFAKNRIQSFDTMQFITSKSRGVFMSETMKYILVELSFFENSLILGYGNPHQDCM